MGDLIILAKREVEFYLIVCDLTLTLTSLDLKWNLLKLEVLSNHWGRTTVGCLDSIMDINIPLASDGLYEDQSTGGETMTVLGVACDCGGTL